MGCCGSKPPPEEANDDADAEADAQDRKLGSKAGSSVHDVSSKKGLSRSPNSTEGDQQNPANSVIMPDGKGTQQNISGPNGPNGPNGIQDGSGNPQPKMGTRQVSQGDSDLSVNLREQPTNKTESTGGIRGFTKQDIDERKTQLLKTIRSGGKGEHKVRFVGHSPGDSDLSMPTRGSIHKSKNISDLSIKMDSPTGQNINTAAYSAPPPRQHFQTSSSVIVHQKHTFNQAGEVKTFGHDIGFQFNPESRGSDLSLATRERARTRGSDLSLTLARAPSLTVSTTDINNVIKVDDQTVSSVNITQTVKQKTNRSQQSFLLQDVKKETDAPSKAKVTDTGKGKVTNCDTVEFNKQEAHMVFPEEGKKMKEPKDASKKPGQAKSAEDRKHQTIGAKPRRGRLLPMQPTAKDAKASNTKRHIRSRNVCSPKCVTKKNDNCLPQCI